MSAKGWQCEPTTGPAPTSTAFQTLNLWGDQLVAYGSDGLALLDLPSKTWSAPPIDGLSPGPRTQHSCVIHKSKLVLFGGLSSGQPTDAALWVLELNPAWLRPLRHAIQQQHHATLDKNCAKLINGFADTPLTWRKADTDAAIEPRHGHTAVLDPRSGGIMIVFGGSDGTFCLDTTCTVNLSDGLWERMEPNGLVPPPRTDHTSTLIGDQMYVFGGTKYRTYMNDLWVLNLSTETWGQVHVGSVPPRSPTVRFGHSMVHFQGGLFVYGGHAKGLAPTPQDRCTNDLWMWDLNTSSWVQMEAKKTTHPPPPTTGHRAIVWNDAMWVFGGRDDVHPEKPHSAELWAYRVANEAQSASCTVQ